MVHKCDAHSASASRQCRWSTNLMVHIITHTIDGSLSHHLWCYYGFTSYRAKLNKQCFTSNVYVPTHPPSSSTWSWASTTWGQRAQCKEIGKSNWGMQWSCSYECLKQWKYVKGGAITQYWSLIIIWSQWPLSCIMHNWIFPDRVTSFTSTIVTY